MPIFREVEVYPTNGFGSWVPWNADDDAFARRARSICEAYSQSLPGLGLRARATLLRLNCDTDSLRPDFQRQRPQLDDPVDTALLVNAEFIETMEVGTVWVPSGYAEAPMETQQLWTLDVTHEAARQLARLRGGDPDLLQVARQHVIDQGMQFVFLGRWKASSDRRHRARLVVSIDEQGVAYVRLQVATSAGEIVAQRDTQLSWNDGAYLMSLTKTVRWHGSLVRAANLAVQI